jgi:hypothetical protein
MIVPAADSFPIYWESDNLVVLDCVDALPLGPEYPYNLSRTMQYKERDENDIKLVVYHHTAGNYLPAVQGLWASNAYCIRAPGRYADGQPNPRIGRGWPKIPYHVYVPHQPLLWESDRAWGDGRYVIYQLNHFHQRTWHTRGANDDGASAVFQGNFSTRRSGKRMLRHPSDLQMEIAPLLWNEYLKPTLSLQDADLRGHFDFTKPACPGWMLKNYVIKTRTQ